MLLRINHEIYLFIYCALDEEFSMKKAESVTLQAVLFISWKKRKEKKNTEPRNSESYYTRAEIWGNCLSLQSVLERSREGVVLAENNHDNQAEVPGNMRNENGKEKREKFKG